MNMSFNKILIVLSSIGIISLTILFYSGHAVLVGGTWHDVMYYCGVMGMCGGGFTILITAHAWYCDKKAQGKLFHY